MYVGGNEGSWTRQRRQRRKSDTAKCDPNGDTAMQRVVLVLSRFCPGLGCWYAGVREERVEFLYFGCLAGFFFFSFFHFFFFRVTAMERSKGCVEMAEAE